jgi:hypothetical protein
MMNSHRRFNIGQVRSLPELAEKLTKHTYMFGPYKENQRKFSLWMGSTYELYALVRMILREKNCLAG